MFRGGHLWGFAAWDGGVLLVCTFVLDRDDIEPPLICSPVERRDWLAPAAWNRPAVEISQQLKEGVLREEADERGSDHVLATSQCVLRSTHAPLHIEFDCLSNLGDAEGVVVLDDEVVKLPAVGELVEEGDHCRQACNDRIFYNCRPMVVLERGDDGSPVEEPIICGERPDADGISMTEFTARKLLAKLLADGFNRAKLLCAATH